MRAPQSYWLTGLILLASLWAGSYASLRTLRSRHVNVGPAITCDLYELGPFHPPPEAFHPERHIQLLESGELARPIHRTANLLFWPLLKLDEKCTGVPVNFGGYPML